MVIKSSLSVVCILVFTVFNANASVVYTYTGNNFTSVTAPYTTDMNVILQFETASPLSGAGAMTNYSAEILSYTMFDGRYTLTEADSSIDISLNIDTTTSLPSEWRIYASNISGKTTGDKVNRMETTYDAHISVGRDFVEDLECAFVATDTGECMGFTNVIIAYETYLPDTSGTWSVVPVPGAVWLFGSGLIGLIGMAGRKTCK